MVILWYYNGIIMVLSSDEEWRSIEERAQKQQ